MDGQYKRTRFWVDTAFQLRLLGRMTLYVLVIAFVGFHIGFIYEAMVSIASNGLRKQMGDLYMDYLRQQRSLLLAVVTILPILLYDMVKFSNRIAGPLFRCRKVMLEMAEGKPVPAFTPRKGDFMTEFFQAFNDLIRTWNHRVGPAAANTESADNPAVAADKNVVPAAHADRANVAAQVPV